MTKHSAIGGQTAVYDQRRVLQSLVYDNLMLMLNFDLDFHRDTIYMSKSTNSHRRSVHLEQLDDRKDFVLVANIDSTTGNVIWHKFYKKGRFPNAVR